MWKLFQLPERRRQQLPLPRIADRRHDLDNPLTRFWDAIYSVGGYLGSALMSAIFWETLGKDAVSLASGAAAILSFFIAAVHSIRLVRSMGRRVPIKDERAQ